MPEAHVVYGKEAPTGLYLHTSVEEAPKTSVLASTATIVTGAITRAGQALTRTVTTLRALAPNLN